MSTRSPLETGKGSLASLTITFLLPSLLVFLSGFASLVYQVLWMKQLGLLFGNTAHAAAMTLAVFFAGLAAGSWFWGRRTRTIRNPMMAYAWLEAGIAVTALLYFATLAIFYSVYPLVYKSVTSGGLMFAVKCLLAMLLIFPPAFFMGGTIPVIGQAVIRDKSQLGAKASWLYAVNTLGAALGALTAGFFLVRSIGFRLTCLSAVGITCLVAAGAALLARGRGTAEDSEEPAGAAQPDSKPEPRERGTQPWAYPLYAVCVLSGFGFLAMEVIWTRLLSQIHTNSVYSFSLVLVLVLVALSLGAAAASGLARLKLGIPPFVILASLLLLAGTGLAFSPFVFMEVTNDFQMLQTGSDLGGYLYQLLWTATLVIGIPAFILGTIFPYIMKAAERLSDEVGVSLGRLSAINTVGAIAGSLLCGFLFLEHFGMWRTMQVISAIYLVAGASIAAKVQRAGICFGALGAAMLVVLFSALDPSNLRVTGWDPMRPPEREIEVWETSDGTVSVVMNDRDGGVIRLNSNYSLGSTGAALRQHFQGRVPLLAYPETESIFFLGVGTGISAGAALDPRFTKVNRVVACELVPEVVEAAEKYMTGAFGGESGPIDYTSGLFDDSRVEIVEGDGRHYLMASGETFDMINADLFLPYRSGAGSLYSIEHFRNVKASLNPGGVFVQWLPMYQITEEEFGSIARTMLKVFDEVTVWRNDFFPSQESIALFGHRDPEPLPPFDGTDSTSRFDEVSGLNPLSIDVLNITFDEETALVFYCGNLSRSKDRFSRYPLNTDDQPVIEYSTPLSLRKNVDGFPPTLVGPRHEKFMASILAACHPDDDPMLVRRTESNRRLVLAGAELYRFWLNRRMADASAESARYCSDPRERMALIEEASLYGQIANAAWLRFAREWGDQD